ncbi:hydroxysteroid 11-beta-dehydrogenase 1-like protein [Bolinopsis microptera]|uniref:hydroxysteroid 11-beta-dehydrogenase 1-like protein n=1 Tax=Bolinopsis microptera TaxID=2820187 RepID=UPI00307A2D23
MNYKIPLLIVLISASLYYFFSPASPLSDTQLTEHLNGKVVLICGASSGIGEELAYQLAAHGAKLVLVARSQDKLDKVRTEIIKRGAPDEDVITISLDFSDVSKSKEVVDQTLEKFGGLDYLVSNHAAIFTGPFLGLPHLQDPEYIEKIFRVNLFSHIQLAVHALPHLEKNNGHIYFTSSLAGEIPVYRSSLYCSTKHAMNGFFYSLQQELLARESSVSLTIGSLGLILTKEISQLMAFGHPYPAWARGSLEECSRGVMEAYITRPQTMTYPRIAGMIYRANWYFDPHFHEGIIQRFKAKGTEGKGYKEVVEKVSQTADLLKNMEYQLGYGPGDK